MSNFKKSHKILDKISWNLQNIFHIFNSNWKTSDKVLSLNKECFIKDSGLTVLDNSDLEKVCRLAKINIEPEGKDIFLGKLNQVFEWIEQLSKIDASNIDINNLQDMDETPERLDASQMENSREELLSNTKHKKFDMFCVPKVVE